MRDWIKKKAAWAGLSNAIKKRDKLMHPHEASDIHVSDEDYRSFGHSIDITKYLHKLSELHYKKVVGYYREERARIAAESLKIKKEMEEYDLQKLQSLQGQYEPAVIDVEG